MAAPEENTKFYSVHGNKYENLMSNNDKISMDLIEHGIGEKPDTQAEKKKEDTKNIKIAQVK